MLTDSTCATLFLHSSKGWVLCLPVLQERLLLLAYSTLYGINHNYSPYLNRLRVKLALSLLVVPVRVSIPEMVGPSTYFVGLKANSHTEAELNDPVQ